MPGRLSTLPLPMKATAGELPTGDDWVFEIKWDGMRAIVGVADGEVRVRSARGNDATTAYPELAGLATSLGVGSAVLDGELVAFDPDGRPSFSALQSRMHVTSERVAAERAAQTPCTYFVFDLLELDGQELVDLPWRDRRRLLEQLVDSGPHWQVPPVHDDGPSLFAAAQDRALEGVVAKREDSRYRPGARTKEWIKIKVRNRQEFVVGGWAPGSGGRAGRIGGLLLGAHEPGADALRYVGRVGSGLSDALVARLQRRFASEVIDDCPFDPPPPAAQATGAVWVKPQLVVEVGFAEWTPDGRLRHPTFEGIRDDKDPADVTTAP